ncbi:nicotinamide riboside transporter PnuC [Hymenobacter jeollabukensis]|uniref:nicotinamide riboside transporter PnuC n=1 Tax=Hymenobacter jeollabukensis TaxID=2025313 RepID=UPI0014859EA4|nr:nicotinamide riboside transporter PnuC [Hymenobacter jeollabukensis]
MSWYDLLTAVAGTGPLEWAAFATGLACVVLAAVGTIWNFPVAIVSCAFYVVVFHRAQLYSDRNLQFVFIAMSVYGWYEWLRGGKAHTALVVTHSTAREWLWLTLAGACYTGGFGYYLAHHTDAALPFLDSLTTAISLMAQYLMTRKRLENWLLWILVDIIYVPMYWVKSLHATSGLYLLYLGIAAFGYWEWRRLMRQAQAAPAFDTATPPTR